MVLQFLVQQSWRCGLGAAVFGAAVFGAAVLGLQSWSCSLWCSSLGAAVLELQSWSCGRGAAVLALRSWCSSLGAVDYLGGAVYQHGCYCSFCCVRVHCELPSVHGSCVPLRDDARLASVRMALTSLIISSSCSSALQQYNKYVWKMKITGFAKLVSDIVYTNSPYM